MCVCRYVPARNSSPPLGIPDVELLILFLLGVLDSFVSYIDYVNNAFLRSSVMNMSPRCWFYSGLQIVPFPVGTEDIMSNCP
jgi:hypothetical protein